jgi:hypothetical protein
MRALMTDGPTVVTALSPWILPLVAIAAKRKEELAERACPSRILLSWWRGRDRTGSDDRRRQQVVIDERIRARIEATIWPE